MLIPNAIPEYDIYDILYTGDKRLVIVMPAEHDAIDVKLLLYQDVINFKLERCPEKHVYVYTSEYAVEYSETVKLLINGREIETAVSKYPEFKDEIIMSTLVKGEDDCIVQWIEFYLHQGVSRFIIYDNSDESTLCDVLRAYIDKGQVLLIRWNYIYRRPISGFSAQQTQQTHSIHAFRSSKYIGMFDVDEYLNLQKDGDIDTFFKDIINKQGLNVEEIGAFQLLSRQFYNPNKLDISGNKFLEIFNCDPVRLHYQEKCFAIPRNVNIFCVHKITSGKKLHKISPDDGYFNHYWYLSKKQRECPPADTIGTDDSILKHLKYID